jgi:hypothetical protein
MTNDKSFFLPCRKPLALGPTSAASPMSNVK